MDHAEPGRVGRIGLGPYPTAAFIRSRVEAARAARDAANRAAVKLVASSLAAGARLAATILAQCVLRLARKSRYSEAA